MRMKHCSAVFIQKWQIEPILKFKPFIKALIVVLVKCWCGQLKSVSIENGGANYNNNNFQVIMKSYNKELNEYIKVYCKNLSYWAQRKKGWSNSITVWQQNSNYSFLLHKRLHSFGQL